MLNRKSESKYITSRNGNTTPHAWNNFNSTIVGVGQFWPVIPTISQGTEEYQRIGDSITPTKFKVDLSVRFRPDQQFQSGVPSQVDPRDVVVVVYYGVCKKFKKILDVQNNSATLTPSLLRLGGLDPAVGGLETSPFLGYAEDDHLLTNSTIFQLKKKRIHLMKTANQVNGPPGVTGGPNINQARVTLDFSSFLPAKLKYDTTTDTLPSNMSPFYCLGYYYTDASLPDDGSTPQLSGKLQHYATPHLWYKDM